MKRFFILCFFTCLLAIPRYAFADDSKFNFSVRGGLNLSQFNGDADKNSWKPGYKLGATVDYNVIPHVFIRSGLDFEMVGGKIKNEDPELKYKANMNPMYLKMPIHVGTKLESLNVGFNFSTGIYLGYGVGGSIRTESTVKGREQVSEKHSAFGDNGFKRFDMGFALQAGLRLGSLQISLGYDIGLTNIAKHREEDLSPSLKNRSAYLSFGYHF